MNFELQMLILILKHMLHVKGIFIKHPKKFYIYVSDGDKLHSLELILEDDK